MSDDTPIYKSLADLPDPTSPEEIEKQRLRMLADFEDDN